MNFRPRIALHLAALFVVLGTYSFAADDAYLYIIHAIPGRNVASNLNPGLPIDILINGKLCLVRGLTFGNTSGPLSLAPAHYQVQISLANTLAPCTNPAVIDSPVTLASGQNVSAVATLIASQAALLQFPVNLAPLAAGSTRFVLVNSADAPALTATLTQQDVPKPKAFSLTANPGAQAGTTVPVGTYLVQVTQAGSSTVLTSQKIAFADQSATFSYASGSTSNNTVELVNRVIRDVF
jgi:Domain of unknown function (DUF4397)